MGVTINDVAKACGVSRGTVDRAFNNKPRINIETKEKILETAKKMGYRPDLLARSMVKGRTMSIGVVVFDLKNRIFAQLVNSIESQARKCNYFIDIMLQEEDPGLEIQLINTLVARRVDGIILCPVNKGISFNKFINDLPVPVLVIGNMLSQSIPFVGIDEYEAAQEATETIISKKYERVYFVCPPLENNKKENLYSHEQRLKGFRATIEKYGNIESDVIDNWQYVSCIETLVKDKSKKTALFCSGDIYALNILRHLRNLGVKVPRDIGIMGFDGIDMLEYISPALSTVYYPVEKIGTRSVDTLIKLIDGINTEKHSIMEHEIIIGESL